MIRISGSLKMLWVGVQCSSAKSAPNLSQNGFTTSQITTRKASTSCNHVCMDAMQDKLKCIGDEWAVIRISGSLKMLRVGVQCAVAQNLPQISAKTASPPAKSQPEKLLHHAIMFVWMPCKTNSSPLEMNGL